MKRGGVWRAMEIEKGLSVTVRNLGGEGSKAPTVGVLDYGEPLQQIIPLVPLTFGIVYLYTAVRS